MPSNNFLDLFTAFSASFESWKGTNQPNKEINKSKQESKKENDEDLGQYWNSSISKRLNT